MDKKKENIELVAFGVLLVILIVTWLGVRIYNVQATNQLNTMQDKLSVEQEKYNNKLKNAEKQYIVNYANDDNHKDPNILSISDQINNYNTLNQANNSFFKVYFKYDSQKEYTQRKDKLSYMLTDNVKNDTKIFDSGKTSGFNTVDILNQEVTFSNVNTYLTSVNNNSIQGVANVTFKVNGKDCLRVYQVTYDKTIQKFTEIKLLQVSGQNTNLGNYN